MRIRSFDQTEVRRVLFGVCRFFLWIGRDTGGWKEGELFDGTPGKQAGVHSIKGKSQLNAFG